MLDCQSHLFQLDPDFAFLNGAYMSPQMKSVHEAGIQSLVKKSQPWKIKLSDFFEPVQLLKKRFTQLINIDETERIALMPSVSYSVANIAKNLDCHKGQNIVVLGEQFPSNYYSWKRLAEEKQLELRVVETPTEKNNRGSIWNEKVLQAIDEQTLLVAMSHIHWTDGTLFDLETIRAKTDQYNSYLIIDGTQSVGALPFDVKKIRPDALICAGYKWLMGPYGLGLSYFGPRFDNGVPIEENWIHRHNSHEFQNLVNYQEEYKPLANRFSVGEVSNFVYVDMLNKALEQVNDWSQNEIQDYCQTISKEAIDLLREKGCVIENDEFRAQHLFGIRLPDDIDFEKLRQRFEDNKVVVSFRGNAIRVSAHVYNRKEEFDRLASCF